jgi:hypothetical protein
MSGQRTKAEFQTETHDRQKSAGLFERSKQARRPARKFKTEGTNLRAEQADRRVPLINRTNTTKLGIGLRWELEIGRKPIHLVFTAIA